MQLRLGRPGTNSTPRDQIRQELRRDRIQQLASDGDTHICQLTQQTPGNPEALINLEGAIDIGVINESFPTDGGTGLFKVGTHDDQNLAREFVGEGFEEFGVFESCTGVVDGARTDDDNETVVLAAEDLGSLLAGERDHLS